MGIFGAMTTAVSGMKAQSYAMENISGNIANSRTTGFKRVDTSFVDLVQEAPRRREIAGSVSGYAQATNTIQGDLTSTGVGTNIAINGEGFFAVQARTGLAGGVPVFNGSDVYTRRGDFDQDASGYLVNGAGYYLKGIPLDPITQDVIGSQSSVIKINGDNLPALATTQLEYRANLPPRPATNNYDATVPGSELLVAPFNAAAIAASAEGGFLDQTITGGATSVYNASGARVDVQMRWGKTVSAPPTWHAYYLTDSNATGATTKWAQIPGTFVFSNTAPTTGQLVSSPAAPVTFTVDGTATDPITFSTGGLLGMTQFAQGAVNEGGNVNVNALQQNGYPSGELVSVSVGEGGRLQGNYNNGQVVGLFQLSVAQFSNPNGLKRSDGGVFEQTIDSGPPVTEDIGRAIVGGSLENSNTDIADEFSKMIVTQQAYSANTRVISTSSDMLREAIN
ncbi:MAG: flagellar hook protein FlgE, partial [Beijerinckiaceae bacterium]